MADVSDIEEALAAAVRPIRDAAFPTGVVGRGWPSSAEFAAATRAPMVTVYQRPGFSRLTSRYPVLEDMLPPVAPTLTVTAAGDAATFAGTCSTDQIAGVQQGTTAWAVRCQAGDTPASVAASLAALSGASASGPTLTLPGLVAARTARDAIAIRRTRQQQVQFAVIIWTSDPATRDAVSAEIDSALSDVEFLPLPDGTAGRLTWAGTMSNDRAQNSDLYRRDLLYAVDFATTRRISRTPVLFYGVTFAPGSLRFGALHP